MTKIYNAFKPLTSIQEMVKWKPNGINNKENEKFEKSCGFSWICGFSELFQHRRGKISFFEFSEILWCSWEKNAKQTSKILKSILTCFSHANAWHKFEKSLFALEIKTAAALKSIESMLWCKSILQVSYHRWKRSLCDRRNDEWSLTH